MLNQNIEIVEYLLKNGANPFLRDDLNKTVMDLTVHLDIISMLNVNLELELWKKAQRASLYSDVGIKGTLLIKSIYYWLQADVVFDSFMYKIYFY